MRTLLVAALCAVLVCLSGCASLGMAPAQNAQEQIAYGYSGVTAALNTLAQATSSGVVSSAEATQVNSALLAVKGQLDQAEAVVSTNGSQSVQILAAATSALTGISSYLACRQAKETTCQLP